MATCFSTISIDQGSLLFWNWPLVHALKNIKIHWNCCKYNSFSTSVIFVSPWLSKIGPRFYAKFCRPTPWASFFFFFFFKLAPGLSSIVSHHNTSKKILFDISGTQIRCVLQANRPRVSQRILPHPPSHHLLLPRRRQHLGHWATCWEQRYAAGEVNKAPAVAQEWPGRPLALEGLESGYWCDILWQDFPHYCLW